MKSSVDQALGQYNVTPLPHTCNMFEVYLCRYTSSLTGNISDIFQRILDDVTFSRRSEFLQIMKTFAYSLLDGELCNVKSV